ncbi:hypothetical protein [Noviherbaspirillum saxi]|nr:hypothetical protein [Noviherbaspirillum saxi]
MTRLSPELLHLVELIMNDDKQSKSQVTMTMDGHIAILSLDNVAK